MDEMANGPHYDHHGLEILDDAECLRLLQTVDFGRVAVTYNALPLILPVSFALLDGGVVFATGPGTKLAAATERAIVAFEADQADLEGRTAWSVCITGMAEEITDRDMRRRAADLGLAPMIPIHTPRYVRVRNELCSGRRASLPVSIPADIS